MTSAPYELHCCSMGRIGLTTRERSVTHQAGSCRTLLSIILVAGKALFSIFRFFKLSALAEYFTLTQRHRLIGEISHRSLAKKKQQQNNQQRENWNPRRDSLLHVWTRTITAPSEYDYPTCCLYDVMASSRLREHKHPGPHLTEEDT